MLNEQITLRAIFESSAEGIIIVDSTGEITKANPKSEWMFGYERGELVGMKLETLLPARYRNVHKGFRKSYFQHPKPRSMGQGLDLFAARKDGSEFPIEVSLSYTKIGDELFAIAFMINITERKKAEDRLQQSEERLRYYVLHTPTPVVMTDKSLRYLLVSDRWAEEYGYQNTDLLIGKNHAEVFPYYQPQWDALYQKCLKGEFVKVDEERVYHSDGSVDWLRWEARAWEDAAGEVGGLIIFIEPITKRKIAEEALRKSRAKLRSYTVRLERSNRELEDFAYVSSHDLQEPLRKIQAFGDRIKTKEGHKLSEIGTDYLNRMLNSASRMQKLINDLLSFSRLSTKALPFTEINLNNVLKDVLSDLELKIEKTNTVIETTDLPIVQGDPTQLRQLFQNLITNAIKFQPEGQQPHITISFHPDHEEADEFAQISIKDNGIGFDEKYLDRIFNIFQRLEGRKFEGSGIGLSVCKRITQRHGGDIMAESKLGEGSVFTIKLAYRPSRESDNYS